MAESQRFQTHLDNNSGIYWLYNFKKVNTLQAARNSGTLSLLTTNLVNKHNVPIEVAERHLLYCIAQLMSDETNNFTSEQCSQMLQAFSNILTEEQRETIKNNFKV